MLLDMKEANVKEVVLYEQYLEIKDEVENLKKRLDEPKRQKPKTMGSGGNEDE